MYAVSTTLMVSIILINMTQAVNWNLITIEASKGVFSINLSNNDIRPNFFGLIVFPMIYQSLFTGISKEFEKILTTYIYFLKTQNSN